MPNTLQDWLDQTPSTNGHEQSRQRHAESLRELAGILLKAGFTPDQTTVLAGLVDGIVDELAGVRRQATALEARCG